MTVERVPLAGGWIDRDAETRVSEEALDRAWADPRARLLWLHGATVPVAASGALALVPTAAVTVSRPERLFLGRRDGAPVFAAGADSAQEIVGASWLHPFEFAAELHPAEREIVVAASALVRWHEQAGYAPGSGEPTEVADGGWSRRTPEGGELFPRTDPAVIVLIEHEGRVLLGSNTLWESGRFSLLAGFVEAGETLEQAVAREVFEESGVRLGEVRYVASQPWPFPRSLMLGFRAGLAEDQDPADLRPDTSEISELRWFTREEVASPPAGIRLPTSLSIAGWMLENWAAESGR